MRILWSQLDEGGTMTDKPKLRRRLAREDAAIKHRLESGVVPNLGGPVLGRANIAYELSERTRGTAHGGMGMIAKLVPSLSDW